MPDAAIFDRFSPRPTLTTICKFKANPNTPKVLKDLGQQVASYIEFLEGYKGKSIVFLGNGISLDKQRAWKVRDIKVSIKPLIIIFIPQGRTYLSTNNLVEIKHSSFGPAQLGKITATILDDAFEQGYLEPNMRIVKETLDGWTGQEKNNNFPRTLLDWRDYFASKRSNQV